MLKKYIVYFLVSGILLFIVNCSASLQKLSTECHSGNKQSCDKLQQAALKIVLDADKKDKERLDAYNYITDPEILCEIVINNKRFPRINYDAFNKVSDQKLLIKIAKEANNDFVRYGAVKKITDQDALVEVAKTNTVNEIRYMAVKRITDHQALAEIAKNDTLDIVYCEAIKKLEHDTDPVVELILSRGDLTAQTKMMKAITNQDALVKIAKNSDSEMIQKEAIANLTDYDLLREIADSENLTSISGMADEKLVFQEKYTNRILKGERYLSLDKIDIQYFLGQIAMSESLYKNDAIKKLTDQKILAEIVLAAKKYDTKRDRAYKKLNPGWKSKIAPWVDSKALDGITDPKFLFEICQNSKVDTVQIAAAQKLTAFNEPKLLFEICLTSENLEIRDIVANKLGDFSDDFITDSLLSIISTPDHELTENAIFALARISKPRVIDPLIELLKQKPQFEEDILEALSHYKDERIIKIFTPIISDLELYKTEKSENFATKQIEGLFNVNSESGQRRSASRQMKDYFLYQDWQKEGTHARLLLTYAEKAFIQQGRSVVPLLESILEKNKYKSAYPFMEKRIQRILDEIDKN